MLHLLSLWFLRRYNSSLWGKLYKSGISLRTDRSSTLWYRIASTLLTFWHLCGVRADEGDLRNRSVPSEAHKAVFCFMLRCLLPPPNVIMLPTHPITRSSVARAPESKQRRRWQGCMCACLTGVPEVTLAQTLEHTPLPTDCRRTLETWNLLWEFKVHCNHGKKNKNIKSNRWSFVEE